MNAGKFSRRALFQSASIAAAGAVTAPLLAQDAASQITRVVNKGRIQQSASRWCYGKIPLDELCAAGAKMGLKGIDLLSPKDFPVLRRHGLVCTMTSGGGDLNDKAKHERAIAQIRTAIDANAEYGFANVIAMAGNRNGIPDDVGIENAVDALKQIAGYAEQKHVNICIEYLNSKVDHPGYMFDNMAWGVEVCQRVGSANVKILYDIYHAQIMEGDIIRTIRTHKDLIGHYHTGGNPGRHEIDQTQELFYPAIMHAIVETGFTGFVAHEFVPTRDPLTSLAEAVAICDV